MKIQPMHDLMAEMRAVARGEIQPPTTGACCAPFATQTVNRRRVPAAIIDTLRVEIARYAVAYRIEVLPMRVRSWTGALCHPTDRCRLFHERIFTANNTRDARKFMQMFQVWSVPSDDRICVDSRTSLFLSAIKILSLNGAIL